MLATLCTWREATGDGGEPSGRAQPCMALTLMPLMAWNGPGPTFRSTANAGAARLQDAAPGLEVYKAGSWHLVEPLADALVINIGDIAQVLSNDRYHATLHRVRASSTGERYSVPFFFNPAYSASYQPLSSVVETDQSPLYSAINWGEFRASRAAGDYADIGEEIQISDFRL